MLSQSFAARIFGIGCAFAVGAGRVRKCIESQCMPESGLAGRRGAAWRRSRLSLSHRASLPAYQGGMRLAPARVFEFCGLLARRDSVS